MGTRALIGYLDTSKKPMVLTSTYNHWDGYPENLGKGLENFYNDDAKAKEIANVGYISYLDPETGEWDAKNKDAADVTQLSSDFNEAMSEIAEKIDTYGADFGYIWCSSSDKWETFQNKGIGALEFQLEKAFEHLNTTSDQFDPDEANTYAAFSRMGEGKEEINLSESFVHRMKYRAGIIK